jgi:agmatinase
MKWAGYDRAQVIVIPAPYEGTVTYGKGTKHGPSAILSASYQVELYDMYLDRDVYKVGIHMIPRLRLPEEPGLAISAVKNSTRKVLAAKKFPVLIGGEHSLSRGAIQACMEKFQGLSVLQLDAHADLRDTYEGTPDSHACVMRRVADMGIPFVPVGIRSMSREEANWIRRNKQKVFTPETIKGKRAWIKDALALLTDRVYLTLDLDVLDPAEMPAVGTPEPGGLTYMELIHICRALGRSRKKVVGFDLMELAPIPGIHAPEFLAARLLYHLIGLFCTEGRKQD